MGHRNAAPDVGWKGTWLHFAVSPFITGAVVMGTEQLCVRRNYNVTFMWWEWAVGHVCRQYPKSHVNRAREPAEEGERSEEDEETRGSGSELGIFTVEETPKAGTQQDSITEAAKLLTESEKDDQMEEVLQNVDHAEFAGE